MRQRYVKNQEELLKDCKHYIEIPKKMIGKWNNKEGNAKEKYDEVRIEIGMGKGQFIFNLAKDYENCRYIGIEICKPVLALATKKLKRFKEENDVLLENLSVISVDAIKLQEIFKKNEVDKIYLNFSDPWPKKKHEKRRLTSDDFLEVYKNILRKNGEIELKTDNRHFFEYTLVNLNKNKVNIKYISLNLHEEKDVENVMTEYEEKFSEKGPICKVVFSFN